MAFTAVPEKVLMQVNKYVHPCERFPPFLKDTDRVQFEKDCSLHSNERISSYLQTFDAKLSEMFFGRADGTHTRIGRYESVYLEPF